MRRPLLAIVALLSACVTGATTFADDFTLTVRDAPGARRFELELTAGAVPICFGIQQWPDAHGRLDTGSLAHVVTDAGRFAARNFNFGYCPGGCGELRVEPGARLSAVISYDEFPQAAQLSASSARHLHFAFRPYRCR